MLTLKHLSISRTSSPSRSPAPSSPAAPNSSNSSFASSAPSTRPSSTDSKAGDVRVQVVDNSNMNPDGTAPRRQSVGAMGSLGAALRRASSFRSATPTALAVPASAPAPRPTSDSLLPPRYSGAHSSAHHAVGKPRSKSSAPTLARAGGPHGISPLTATSAVPHAHSQPPVSRHHPSGSGNGKLTPAAAAAASGVHTPIIGGRPPNAGLALHNLEESYVGKVNLKLSDAVNKVFVPAPGPVAAADLCWKGRCPPRYLKAREVGELVVQELRAASHDQYLLHTLLRSPVAKSLSFFLTRLSALFLPSEPFAPTCAKDLDVAQLPLSLRFNLQVIRCAYELKHALSFAPHEVEETLRPWKEKLGEIMARVMGPLVSALCGAVVAICAKARVVELTAGGAAATAVSGGAMMLEAASTSVKSPAAPRALSLGWVGPASTSAGGAGPAWIRDLANLLSAIEKLIAKLECGADADRWLVSVGTCAVWKGLLALSARKLFEEPVAKEVSSAKGLFKAAVKGVKSSPPSPPDSPKLRAVPLDATVPSQQGTAPVSDVAFIRLLGELELFESRLSTYTAALSVPSVTANNGVMSGHCADVSTCGLCKTGRQFDAESSDDDDDEPGRGLALCAMREAMQALSAMIVVVRASGGRWGLKDALLFSAGGGGSTSTSTTRSADSKLVPATPMTLLNASRGPVPVVGEAAPTPANPTCPTLLHALDTLPTLLLLHLLVSRLPPSVPFKLPNEVWGLSWLEYASELRGFAAAEEWTPEIGWEMAGEVERCEALLPKTSAEDARARVALLATAIHTRVGVDVES